jgi:menaquinone-dependent protoporphyrinogen oxidase
MIWQESREGRGEPMSSVLVAYATTYGSTQEVAEKIGQVLSDAGHDVTVAGAQDVQSVETYDAVVLGGALYFFRVHKDFRKFLSRHRRSLESMPVAVFGLGPLNDTEEEWEGAQGHLAKALDKNGWLEPVSVEVFGGVLEPDRLKFPHNNPAMKDMPASDIRDWDAIEAWARSLPDALRL